MAERHPQEFTTLAVKAKELLVNNGVALNESLVKISEDEELTPQQLRLVVNIANRLARNAIAKVATFVEFDVADPDEIEKLIVRQRVRAMLDENAVPKEASFTATMASGHIPHAGTLSTVWKTEEVYQHRDEEVIRKEASAELMNAVENLHANVENLMKYAGVSGGQVMMAAALTDGDSKYPFCMQFCRTFLEPEECWDVEKYASMTLDPTNRTVALLQELKDAGERYLGTATDIEKQAFSLMGAGKTALKSIMPLFVASEMFSGGKKMAQGMQAGMRKAVVPKGIAAAESAAGLQGALPSSMGL